MPARHVVVDGSNIATEGRSMPSLAQLDQAVREFLAENPNDVVTVVVDASFGHRIDPSELLTFEGAEEAGEIISPPAGAIGRGDAFLLRIAEKTGATVLSNDSFQEFHGDHTWLFDKGRLIGGKPVPGVGWIFMGRSPVRGAKSREVVKEAKRKKKDGDEQAGSGLDLVSPRSKSRPKSVDRAIAKATQEVVQPKEAGPSGRRRRGGRPPSDPVNEPLAFITFIAAHPLGSEVVGEVAEYSSHGAVVAADGARCYMPLSAMGDPAPRRAREVVTKGERRPFVVQAFDPLRRGIELAIPGFAHIAGGPTDETVEAEIRHEGEPARPPSRKPKKKAEAPAPPALPEAPVPKKRRGAAAAVEQAGGTAPAHKKAAAKRVPAEKGAAAKKAPAEKGAAAKKTPAEKAVAAKRTPAEKGAAAKKAPAEKGAAAKKAPVEKKAAAKKAPAEKMAEPERPGASKKRGTPEKAATPKKAAPAKNAAASEKAAPQKHAAGKKPAPAKKQAVPMKTPAAKAATAAKKATNLKKGPSRR